MNKINPLYILLLFIVIVCISFTALFFKYSSFNNQIAALNSLKQNAKFYSGLKKSWSNKEQTQDILTSIVNSYKIENITKVKTSSGYKIRLNSSKIKVLNSFVSRVLNSKLFVKNIDITTSYVSLEVEL